jgi:hypothetical protein
LRSSVDTFDVKLYIQLFFNEPFNDIKEDLENSTFQLKTKTDKSSFGKKH